MTSSIPSGRITPRNADAARRLLSRFGDRARHCEVLLAPEGSRR
jgi:hypothetical protein